MNLLTTKMVAEDLGLKQITVIKHIERGNLKADKLGGSWVISAGNYRRFKKWHEANSRKPSGVV